MRTSHTRALERSTFVILLLSMFLALATLVGVVVLLARSNLRLIGSESERTHQASILQATLDSIRDGIAVFAGDRRLQSVQSEFLRPGRSAVEPRGDGDRHRCVPRGGRRTSGQTLSEYRPQRIGESGTEASCRRGSSSRRLFDDRVQWRRACRDCRRNGARAIRTELPSGAKDGGDR